jgi:hypothetical protein
MRQNTALSRAVTAACSDDLHTALFLCISFFDKHSASESAEGQSRACYCCSFNEIPSVHFKLLHFFLLDFILKASVWLNLRLEKFSTFVCCFPFSVPL